MHSLFHTLIQNWLTYWQQRITMSRRHFGLEACSGTPTDGASHQWLLRQVPTAEL